MKVVLFCGGLGTRLREYSDTIPKPMVPVGPRPILWHLMKYYAHYGHKDFILCLGYRGDAIKDFFLEYSEYCTNDFVLRDGGRKIELYNEDIKDWSITFADTGINSNLGQRLLRVRKYLAGEEAFLANYSDGLSDLPLDSYVGDTLSKDVTASFVSVRTSQSFHTVKAAPNGFVTKIQTGVESDLWINGGFFVLRNDIFDVIEEGEELVEAPFRRLVARQKLVTHQHHGFWASMDTLKDKMKLDDMYARGDRPWEVWARPSAPSAKPRSRDVARAAARELEPVS
jgi:glucose-1-phosphate cytidylyltransferase